MSPPAAGFEIVEHTADVAVRGWGPDLASLCEVMARGLFEIITDPETVQPGRERRVHVEGASREDLLHAWLEELNGLHQIHHELYSGFEVRTEPRALDAVVRGEAIDFERHDLRIEVKAVTWHGLRVENTPRGIEATVLLDI